MKITLSARFGRGRTTGGLGERASLRSMFAALPVPYFARLLGLCAGIGFTCVGVRIIAVELRPFSGQPPSITKVTFSPGGMS